MSFERARFIATKDFLYAIRGKEALLWIFVMPIVFFYFIGTVIGGGGFTSGGEAKRPLAVRAEGSPGFLVAELERRLDENGFEVVRTEDETTFASHGRRLQIPDGFTERVLGGTPTPLSLERREVDLSSQLDEVRFVRAVYTLLADVVAAAEAGEEPTPASFARLAAKPRALTLVSRPAGERRRIPTGFDQAIPGILVMFTMIVLLTSGTSTLVVEREQGLLRRLASTPISRGEIVLGKWAGRMLLALVQVAVAMLFGALIFGLDWGPDVLMVALVLVAWAAFCASLGLLLGCIARTASQAIGLGVLTANVLAALGGCWWPIEVTSPAMQSLATVLPTGWAMDAMHQLVNYRAGPASAVGNTLLLALGALAIGWLAVRRFRYE
ncbi:MAG: ABC transporter permease [Planctomycetota bacterium]|nr:ABC transporter permease [Planctomycetota bacterium]